MGLSLLVARAKIITSMLHCAQQAVTCLVLSCLAEVSLQAIEVLGFDCLHQRLLYVKAVIARNLYCVH